MSSQRSIPIVDRISTLPDSIICHILSFLSTKQSATTTILSKRWNPLWLSVLTLDFNNHDFKNFNTFRLFVYSVMLTRDPTLPIQSFRLKCSISPECDSHDINRFLRAAVERGGVQNLNLDLLNGPFQNGLGTIISTIFNSRNLVVLKLTKILVNVLPQINFPLLKTLNLVLVIFQKRNDLSKLIEGCPILEELQLTYVLCKCLEISDGEFKCLPNLVRASIINFNCLPKLLRGNSTTTSFRQLKNISFAWICNAKFLRLELSQEQQVGTFHNLTHMELIFASSWCTKWKWLVQVLQNCPKLQNLIFHNKLYGHGIDEYDWNEPQAIPKCISTQLRTCSLIHYKGMACELQFAKFILKNAKLLHRMTISASSRDLNVKHQMLMDLSLCPRGSTTCKLSFV